MTEYRDPERWRPTPIPREITRTEPSCARGGRWSDCVPSADPWPPKAEEDR